MKVEDRTIIDVMEDHYRHSLGYDISSDFSIDKLTKVRQLLHSLDGEGFSDLEVLRIALKAFELQVIKNS